MRKILPLFFCLLAGSILFAGNKTAMRTAGLYENSDTIRKDTTNKNNTEKDTTDNRRGGGIPEIPDTFIDIPEDTIGGEPIEDDEVLEEDYGHPAVYAPNLSSAYSQPVGSIPGAFSVSPTGGATYSITFNVPKGIGVMQPSVGIGYNSQAGNGIAGWGFSLSGLSAITRAPKDWYHDGMSRGIRHQADDAYYLDGKRLLLSSGTEGTAGAVYTVEGEPFTVVTVYEDGAIDGVWFEVRTPDGMVYEYGHDYEAQQYFPSSTGANTINAWYLSRAVNMQGHDIQYHYTQWYYYVYLTQIIYGNGSATCSIEFEYEERTNDPQPFWIGGQRGVMKRRLKRVTSKTNNSLYRQYELTYNTVSDNSGIKFSRLEKVVERNANGETLRPTFFVWNHLPDGQQTVETIEDNPIKPKNECLNSERPLIAADINGDGLTDLVEIYTSDLGYTYRGHLVAHFAKKDGNGNISFHNCTPFQCPASFSTQSILSLNTQSSTLDFDGDGLTDILVPHFTAAGGGSSTSFSIYYGKDITNHVANPSSANIILTGGHSCPLFAVSDMDNDGRTDILSLETKGVGSSYTCCIFYYGGNNGGYFIKAIPLSIPQEPKKLFVADFNGNGLQDILVFRNNGYSICWNNGGTRLDSLFTPASTTHVTSSNVKDKARIHMGDFNGDGLPDFIMNASNDSKFYFALNNGNGTFTWQLAANIPNTLISTNTSILPYDFNNDGRTDIVLVKARIGGTDTRWLTSDGNTLTQQHLKTTSSQEDASPFNLVLGDFNGDGSTDLLNIGNDLYYSGGERLHIYRNRDLRAGSGRIRYLFDGYGRTTHINYKTLTDSTVYRKGTGSTYPVADLCVPLPVVSQTRTENGAASTFQTTDYTYEGLKVHLRGRGLMGFARTTADNTTTGIRTETEQTWNGQYYVPQSSVTATTAGNQTASESSSVGFTQKGCGNYLATLQQKVTTDFDGNTTTTNYVWNTTNGYLLSEETCYGSASMYRRTDYADYVQKGGAWLPQTVTLTQKHIDDNTPYTDETQISYDERGNKTAVVSHAGKNLELTTQYTYDSYGNRLTETVAGEGIAALTKIYEYDSSGRFPVRSTTLPASSVTTYAHDLWGNLVNETDETDPQHPLTTTYTYDGWGNVSRKTLPTGQYVSYAQGWGNSGAKQYYKAELPSDGPWKKTWYDEQGREVGTESVGEDHIIVNTETTYNVRGLASRKTQTNGYLTSWENYGYDALGRLTSTAASTGSQSATTYGNRSMTTVKDGRTYARTFDAWGSVKTATDPVGSVSYSYHSNGAPSAVSSGGSTVSISCDDCGNRTAITDPDAGTISYTYDALGRIVTQTDARGKVTANTYDHLGRLIESETDGDVTSYTYGTSGTENLLLIREQNAGGTIDYTHDQYGRLLTETRTPTGGAPLTFAYTYNNKGQTASVTYPGNVTVAYEYDENGYRTATLRNSSAGTQPLWQLDYADGTETRTQLGASFSAVTRHNSQGYLQGISLYRGTTRKDSLSLAYDAPTGNLTSRHQQGRQPEIFTYDAADRLTEVQRGGQTVMSIGYAGNGNITAKTDIGSYAYSSTKPHAVTGVENTDGLIPEREQDIAYNAFGKVSSITEDGTAYAIIYGPDQERWQTVLEHPDGTIRSTTYAGNYERIDSAGHSREFYFLDNDVILLRETGQQDRILYAFRDNLGSYLKLYDEQGQAVFEAEYDAWGRQSVTQNDIGFHRGYTGHEHLPEFGLINMNGRMYDPLLGRFLSPDNYVQEPENSQNFNRYAYCLNNPLKYVDPDGELWWLVPVITGAYLGGSSVNGTFNPFKWDYGSWKTYAGIVVGGISSYAGSAIGKSITALALGGGMSLWGASIAGGLIGGMVSGSINGFGFAAIMGGNLEDMMQGMVKGAVMEGFSGALSGGISAAIGKFSGVVGSSLKNGLYELGHSALKGVATGLAKGAVMATMEQDVNYLWKGAAFGAAFGVGMAGLRIGLMGTTIIPPGIEGRFDADDAAMGIKSSYPVYRRGGLIGLFVPGITLGRNMMVNTKYLYSSNDKDVDFYYKTLAHERAHIYQQKIMGCFNFYLRTLYEYVISPGYWNDPYNNPKCLEYWANQYATLTPLDF